MTTWLTVKNWDAFQHYRDRLPPWIKLHRSLLEDYTFSQLPDATKGQLIGIWILAAADGGRVPDDPRWIANKINATDPVDVEALVDAGLLIRNAPKASEKWKSPWPARRVAPKVREAIMLRDAHACRECGLTEHLEIDHVVPISKGGTSDPQNLQVLCRSCNRRKRTRLVEQDAPRTRSPRALARDRGETETEKELAQQSLRGSPETEPEPAPEPVAENTTPPDWTRGVVDLCLEHALPWNHGRVLRVLKPFVRRDGAQALARFREYLTAGRWFADDGAPAETQRALNTLTPERFRDTYDQWAPPEQAA